MIKLQSTAVYDKLLRLPLFIGMSYDELQRIMSKTKIDFGKVPEGSIFVRQGEKCSRLLIVIDGVVHYHGIADDGAFSVDEEIHYPHIVQLESIFGRFQNFMRTITAVTQVSTITIDKNEVLSLISKSLIFRLNLLGLLSTRIQKEEQENWHHQAKLKLEDRIVLLLRRKCLIPTGHKSFKIKMIDLADILNDSRLDVSTALNNLQSKGLIKLSRGKIDVPDMLKLGNAMPF